MARHGLLGQARRLRGFSLPRPRHQQDGQPHQRQREQEQRPLEGRWPFYAAREAIRNAARHGRDAEGERPLHLDVFATWREGLQISIEDNGVGVEAMRPTGGESGRGLALHGTMMAVVGGSLAMESAPGIYLQMP